MNARKKIGPPEMERDIEAGKKIRDLRGALTQKQFAELLRVAQPMISAWEAGRELPASADLWIKFGEFAGWPECFWFWQRAGLSQKSLLAAAQKTLNEQIRDGTSGLEGKVIPVLPFDGDAGKAQEPLLLSGSLLAGPLSTSYFTVDEKSAGYGLKPSDILFIDASDSGSAHLTPHWDEMILVEHDRVAHISSQLKLPLSSPPDIEYVAGWLVLKEYRIGAGMQSIYLAEIDPWVHTLLRPGKVYEAHLHTERLYKHRRSLNHMGDAADGSMTIGRWEGEAAGPSAPGEKWEKNTNDLLDRARREVRLFTGFRILGRVIGWFRPPSKGGK